MAARRAVSRLVQDTTALFVCDIQKTFSKLVPNGDSLVHTSTMLVNAASALDMPVVVTEQSPQKLSSTCDSLKSALPETASVFEKTKFSMVTPEVEAKLQGDLRAVKSIILVGVEAHICVFQTTLDLLEKGYDVHIVADACRSQREADRLFAFERLKQSGAYLTTAESVLFELVRDATHPSFRAISKLAKGHAQYLKNSKI